MNHVMVDLETLDLKPTAVILSIGAVKFNPDTGQVQSPEDGFHVFCRVEDQLQHGFSIAEATLVWWLEHNVDTLRTDWALKQRVPLDEALRLFAQWLPSKEELRGFWSHGAAFDQAVLEYAYRVRSPDTGPPWGHRQSRDTRTLFALAQFELPDNTAKHVAISDAWTQATAVCSAWRQLTCQGHVANTIR